VSVVGVTDDTSKATNSVGYILLTANKKSGTTQGNAGSLANICVIRDNASARFIFQSGGDYFADSSNNASAYDGYDDIGLIRSLEMERTRNPDEMFGEWVRYKRDDLERANIAVFGDDGGMFINYTALARLHSGALWQVGKRIERLENALRKLPIVGKFLQRLLLDDTS
jgi:hypothetical protein